MLKKYVVCLVVSTLAALSAGAETIFYSDLDDNRLANGKEFPLWEKKQKYRNTYYVSSEDANASDTNPGSESLPFKTINAAARILQPGDRVLIKKGVYREKVQPLTGGSSADQMISYEAFPGDSVVICGSVEVDPELFEPSRGWNFKEKKDSKPNVWQLDLDPAWFEGYNPFGMTNLLHDLEWLDYKRARMDSHFKRRGQLYADGVLIEQYPTPEVLASQEAPAYWIEHNGMRLHVKLPDGKTPKDYKWEATNREQVFAPKEYGLGYIRLKGLTFRHAGNGFPVPQRGMVSANRGHHWIIEDCVIENANSVGIDLGNESWHTTYPETFANHIVRRNIIRNCGISGVQCYIAKNMLVEDNLFENIGWQNAEHAFESAGMKFHLSENSLIRRNVFRDIKYAPGLWMDHESTENCRITNNFFHNITTARGAIYIEVSRKPCLIDHNLIIGTRCQWWLSGEYGAGGSGLYTDGSDNITFTNNLVIDAENTGYGSYLNAPRIVGMRGGVTINHSLANNMFIDCKKHCIEFPHQRNTSDKNIFVHPKPGYIKLGNPEPALFLDKEAASELYSWDTNSVIRNDISYSYEDSGKTLVITLKEDLPFEAGPFKLRKGENMINVIPTKTASR